MSTEYVGSVTLYVGATEVEVTKIDVKNITGKKEVKTMNRTRRVKGFTRGVGQYDISFTAVVPTDGTVIDWDKIEDAKSRWFLISMAHVQPLTWASALKRQVKAIRLTTNWSLM